jgi:hypothetical protein
MAKTALQNLLTASFCHKFNFAFASPISCIVLIAIAILTGMTRNYFTNIVKKIADDIGQLACTSPDIATSARKALLDMVDKNPQFVAANTLFQNYVTAFGGAIIGFHIVVIQLFHCCSIFKRSKPAHVCGIIFVTIGAIIFAVAGVVIMSAFFASSAPAAHISCLSQVHWTGHRPGSELCSFCFKAIHDFCDILHRRILLRCWSLFCQHDMLNTCSHPEPMGCCHVRSRGHWHIGQFFWMLPQWLLQVQRIL